ncbi:class I SAM-dependent methyltransferase [Thalassotalea profundi]|uniref:Methyltransferase n=1 Tax=Thalassotalea profundi TaxID=2036687 RepID=A0ABQ3J4X0_9GAMM|nr:class I SAM-dependent methyltransferase [Thalassotalea profundi]GHE99364.1 methyltransferase [Thalassotalea profundi]
MIEYIQFPENLTSLGNSGFSEPDSQRLFHGRGHAYDGLSHVNVDWFSPIIFITLYQAVDPSWLNQQVELLRENIHECKSIQVQHRYIKFSPIEVLWGDDLQQAVAVENDLRYQLTLGKSQNLGLFFDMANGRKWVKENAHGKNILNLFSYTCAFSVAALSGGATQVVNIDMSKSSLSKGRDNHKLNEQDLTKVKFEGVDIFKSYSRLKKYGPYQMLICDPPSFQKGSVNIERDYKKIIKRLPELMSDNADVLLCLNSPDLDEQFLLDEVARECPECQFQYKVENPKVFKEAEQGKGLKVLYFKYKPS